jgi:hypothetical protein
VPTFGWEGNTDHEGSRSISCISWTIYMGPGITAGNSNRPVGDRIFLCVFLVHIEKLVINVSVTKILTKNTKTGRIIV